MDPGLWYRRSAVAGASPVRLVILLYDQVIEDLRRALAAHERAQIEERTRQLNHAVLVIAHLEATLDKTAGGQVTANLERFYRQLRAGLIEAQASQSSAKIAQQISLLVLVRQAWDEVERRIASAEASSQNEPRTLAEWKA
jgi:flagellar protein FliS